MAYFNANFGSPFGMGMPQYNQSFVQNIAPYSPTGSHGYSGFYAPAPAQNDTIEDIAKVLLIAGIGKALLGGGNKQHAAGSLNESSQTQTRAVAAPDYSNGGNTPAIANAPDLTGGGSSGLSGDDIDELLAGGDDDTSTDNDTEEEGRTTPFPNQVEEGSVHLGAAGMYGSGYATARKAARLKAEARNRPVQVLAGDGSGNVRAVNNMLEHRAITVLDDAKSVHAASTKSANAIDELQRQASSAVRGMEDELRAIPDRIDRAQARYDRLLESERKASRLSRANFDVSANGSRRLQRMHQDLESLVARETALTNELPNARNALTNIEARQANIARSHRLASTRHVELEKLVQRLQTTTNQAQADVLRGKIADIVTDLNTHAQASVSELPSRRTVQRLVGEINTVRTNAGLSPVNVRTIADSVEEAVDATRFLNTTSTAGAAGGATGGAGAAAGSGGNSGKLAASATELVDEAADLSKATTQLDATNIAGLQKAGLEVVENGAKAASLGARALSFAGHALPVVGALADGALAVHDIKEGDYTGAAISGGTAVLGTAGVIAAATGATVLGVAAAPVLLGAAAIGGIGHGLYKIFWSKDPEEKAAEA